MQGSGPRLRIKTIAEQDESLRKLDVQAKAHAAKRDRKRRAKKRG